MPAVAGSSRRKSVGPAARPRSRANCQPSATSATTVAIRTGSSTPNDRRAVGVEDQDAGDHRQQHERLDPRALDGAGAQLAREADLAPRVAAGVEQVLHRLLGVRGTGVLWISFHDVALFSPLCDPPHRWSETPCNSECPRSRTGPPASRPAAPAASAAHAARRRSPAASAGRASAGSRRNDPCAASRVVEQPRQPLALRPWAGTRRARRGARSAPTRSGRWERASP